MLCANAHQNTKKAMNIIIYKKRLALAETEDEWQLVATSVLLCVDDCKRRFLRNKAEALPSTKRQVNAMLTFDWSAV